MPSFDQKKAYAEQEEVFFDDGREIELLHYVFGLPELESIRGDPAKVLQAIDKFGREKKYLMNVGEDKGKIVTDLIAEVKPQTMVCEETMFDCCSALTYINSGRTRRLRRLQLYPFRRCRKSCWRKTLLLTRTLS